MIEGSSPNVTGAEDVIFHDGFGDRLLIRDAAGTPVHETLLLRTDLSAVPSFEFQLNQRLTALANFDHESFVHVTRLDKVPGRLPRLSLVADYCPGVRLTDVLTAMESHAAPSAPGAPLFLIKEILGAVGALHRQADVSHGAIAPDRILIADGTVRITDYVMGSAIEQLRFSTERYWKELRVATPASAGAMRFDKRLDVAQVGMVALALFAGRQLSEDEHMGNLGAVLASLSLAQPLQHWLLRTLHMDPRRAYVSATEAASELESAMSEAGVRPSPLELRALGVRPRRVTTTARSAAKPATPAVAVAKPAARVQAKQDQRTGHDATQTMYLPGAIASEPALQSKFGTHLKAIVKIGILGASLAAAFTLAQSLPAPSFLFSKTGTLVVESKPQGVPLTVDGQPQGVTPVTVELKTGRHEVELHGIGKPRVFNVYVSRGAHISQYIEMPRGRVSPPQPAPEIAPTPAIESTPPAVEPALPATP